MTALDRTKTVAQIVLEHSAAAEVFQRHRIDYCCRGELTLSAACTGRGIDVAAVEKDLEAAIQSRAADGPDLRQSTTADLVGYIVSRHHAYLRRALPFLGPLVTKVARVHGDHNRKLEALLDAFRDVREQLEPHLDEEERELFPALLAPDADPRRIADELGQMREEHLRVGETLTRIRTLADDFAVPEWACGSYRAMMKELEALEGDVLRHVHLENHVLAPRFAAQRS